MGTATLHRTTINRGDSLPERQLTARHLTRNI